MPRSFAADAGGQERAFVADMKFLVDAHLPPRLCAVLAQHGHDALHTLDLPAKNATKDSVINQTSLAEQRVVVSKDTDFFYSHMLHGRPWKLLLVRTGNISDLRVVVSDPFKSV